MSVRIPDTHAEAWAMLPWLANARIEAAEREWVEAHVATCAECRAELAAQRALAGAMQREDGAGTAAANDEQRSFNKLWARIEASESLVTTAAGTSGPVNPGARGARTVRWLAAAVVVQALGLGVLGMSALGGGNDNAPADIRTVADPLPTLPAPGVRLVFAPTTSIATINTLLTHQGLEVVSGPGRVGNYTAVLNAAALATGASADSVAEVLAKDPNVVLAEPVAR